MSERADPPGNAIDAAAKAVHERRCTWTTSKSEREYGALDREIAAAALTAAAPVIAAQAARDERQAIIDLAEQRGATYVVGGSWTRGDIGRRSFADLLRGAETTGDNDEHE